MTIPNSWREAYRQQAAAGEKLKSELKVHLAKAPPGWYTETRVKEENSFYQKLETGIVEDFSRLEDFVGALIVVPLPSDIDRVYDFVSSFFVTRYRRPHSDFVASHRATDFRFDDVRLYGTLKSDPSMPPRPLDEIVFEIQLKTFFQHAWSSATHDLVYKHPRFSWSRSRVAAQVRAVLEHAEMSIVALDELEAVPHLARDGDPEAQLNRLLEVVLTYWSDDNFPLNQKRMIESLNGLCEAVSLDSDGLRRLLDEASSELGEHPAGWTPYQCVADYLSRYRSTDLRRALRKKPSRYGVKVIHVTPEILERLGARVEDCPRARL